MKTLHLGKLVIVLCLTCCIALPLAGCNASKKKEDVKEKARLHYEISKTHFHRGNFLNALRELRKSIELNDSDPEAHHLIGKTYYFLKLYPEAETHLKKSIELKENSDTYNTLGNVYLTLGRWDEAIAQFEKCFGDVFYRPSFPAVYTNIGIAYMKKGDMKNAERSFRSAIKLSEKFCVAHLNLGDLLGKTNRGSEAILEYERVIKFCPDSEIALSARLYLATELNAVGHREKACRHLYEIVKKAPESEVAVKAVEYIRLLKCR